MPRELTEMQYRHFMRELNRISDKLESIGKRMERDGAPGTITVNVWQAAEKTEDALTSIAKLIKGW